MPDREDHDTDTLARPRQERQGPSRRAVLVGLGGTAIAAAAGLTGVALVRGSEPNAEEQTEEGVAHIGQVYRRAHPAEDDRDLLRAELPELDADTREGILSQLPRLEERVRADFAEGQIVTVDGWLLARTEARAAALLSLS